MSGLVLVDTSSWIEALRRTGDATVRTRIQGLLDTRAAAWCDMIRLELWRGVQGDAERKGLLRLEATLAELPIDDAVRQPACQTADAARRQGLTIPATDLLIFACAKVHAVAIEHTDAHFDLLGKLTP